jgi:hypothetical protein
VKDFDLSALSDIPDPLAAGSAPRPPLARPPESSPTRAALRRRRRLAAAFAVFWMGGLLAVMGAATDRLGRWEGVVAWVVPAACGFAGLWLALAPGASGLGPSWKSAGALLGCALALFVGVSMLSGATGALAKDSLICGELILVLGAVPLLAVGWALRRSSPTRSLARSALLGGAMGLVAAAVQAVHCPNDSLVHSLVGHGGPILILGLLGATAVRRLTSV